MIHTVGMRREQAGPAKTSPAAEGGEEFTRQTEPFRRELLAHCYRMLGSVHDAEDLVQETMLRAWRARGDFDPGRASIRTWLHRIATNACLTALESRGRRPLPSDLSAPSLDTDHLPSGRRPEITWLQPFPDALLAAGTGGGSGGTGATGGTAGSGSVGETADPAAVVAARDSIRLAFVAALQRLPARQRAVLILRDVLSWRAAEVADLLEITTAAVNSALQRARAELHGTPASPDAATAPLRPRERELADRYLSAFVSADMATLTRLLADEVVLEMPPFLTWFSGRDAVIRFLSARALAGPDRWRAIPVGANGQPAAGLYLRRPDGGHHAHSVHVFTAAQAGIAWVAAFQEPDLFPAFGLPPVYPEPEG